MAKQNFFQKMRSGWKKLSGAFRAFLIVAFCFLALGLGTSGSISSVGKGLELKTSSQGDGKESCVVVRLDPSQSGYNNSNVMVTDVLVNVGALYGKDGSVGTLNVGRATNASNNFSTKFELKFANGYEEVAADKTPTALTGAQYNWVSLAEHSEKWNQEVAKEYSVSTYDYYRFSASGCNLVLNEVVFVGVEKNVAKEDRKPLLIPASVNKEGTVLVDENGKQFWEEANVIFDRQNIPTTAQSSFFRFTEEEAYSLNSIWEMKQGNFYESNVFHGDRVYNSLGVCVLALGTAIFRATPFGLRFFSMLSSLGILLVGFYFVKRLFQSEKAGLAFALIYALSGFGFIIGHLGTPLALGLFFMLSSLSACHKLFACGVKKANFKSCSPALLSGLCGAAAICVNGVYSIPMLGVIALFVAAMVKVNREKNARLAVEIEEAELTEEGSEENVAAKKKILKTLNEGAYKIRVSSALFGSLLIFGALLLTMLTLIPTYRLYSRMYQSGANVVMMAVKVFLGGFFGSNPVANSHSVWSVWNVLFTGSGTGAYAKTVTGLLPSIVAAIIGLAGIVFAIVRLVRGMKSEEKSEVMAKEIASTVICLVGMAICLICAAFAKGGLAFIIGAYLFAFALAGLGMKEIYNQKEGEKSYRWVATLCFVALCVGFALFAAFTFSIPLPAALISKF